MGTKSRIWILRLLSEACPFIRIDVFLDMAARIHQIELTWLPRLQFG